MLDNFIITEKLRENYPTVGQYCEGKWVSVECCRLICYY